MSEYLTVAVILLCLFLEVLYSGGELALFASDGNKLKNLAGHGSKAAQQAVQLKEHPEWFISTALIGTNIAIISASTLVTGLLIARLGPEKGEQAAFLMMIPVLFFMIVLRSVFLHYAETMALAVAYFMRVSSVIFYPIAFVIAAVSRGTVQWSSDSKTGETSHITKEGLKYILGEKTRGSDILTTEKEMISRVFDFSELTADKIMVPISALTCLPASMNISEAVDVVADKKYMRTPVYEDTVFNIVGILHYFDLLEMMLKKKNQEELGEVTVASCMRTDVFFVPETKKVSELLAAMQRKGEQMAVVVDEYGGATGVVTMEDIGEEIVGTIDEYVVGDKLYKKIAPDRYLVSGRLEMDTLRQITGVRFAEGNYETVGGFLMQQMGRIPKPKEIYSCSGVVFVIENADQKSVKEVMVIAPVSLKDGGSVIP